MLSDQVFLVGIYVCVYVCVPVLVFWLDLKGMFQISRVLTDLFVGLVGCVVFFKGVFFSMAGPSYQ